MVYRKKLSAAIKAQGKILREFGDVVYLPFGSEYSIILKNHNNTRALVNVTIDGTDILDEKSLVVNANDTVELDRFINNGNLATGNRLKFIERSAKIEEHRGIKIDDGLIRVEFSFEKAKKLINNDDVHHHHHHHYPMYRPPFYVNSPWWNNSGTSVTYCADPYAPKSFGDAISSNAVRACSVNAFSAVAQAGITVPGSQSDQSFSMINGFDVELEKEVIVLQLVGKSNDVKVTAPVTVKTKLECETCGKANKSTAKFCSECGASLIIFR